MIFFWEVNMKLREIFEIYVPIEPWKKWANLSFRKNSTINSTCKKLEILNFPYSLKIKINLFEKYSFFPIKPCQKVGRFTQKKISQSIQPAEMCKHPFLATFLMLKFQNELFFIHAKLERGLALRKTWSSR